MASVDNTAPSWPLVTSASESGQSCHDFGHEHKTKAPITADEFRRILSLLPLDDAMRTLHSAKLLRTLGGTYGDRLLSWERIARQVRSDFLPRPAKGPFPTDRPVTHDECAFALSSGLDPLTRAACEFQMWKPVLNLELNVGADALARLQAARQTLTQWGPSVQDSLCLAFGVQISLNHEMDPADKFAALDALLSHGIASPTVTLSQMNQEIGWTAYTRDTQNQALLSQFVQLAHTRAAGGRTTALLGLVHLLGKVGAPDTMPNPVRHDAHLDLAARLGARARAETAEGRTIDFAPVLALLTRVQSEHQTPAYVPASRTIELFRDLVALARTVTEGDESHLLGAQVARQALLEFATVFGSADMRLEAYDQVLSLDPPASDAGLGVVTVRDLADLDWADETRDRLNADTIARFVEQAEQRQDRAAAARVLIGMLGRIGAAAEDTPQRKEVIDELRCAVFKKTRHFIDNTLTGIFAGANRERLRAHLESALDVFGDVREEMRWLLQSPSEVDDSDGEPSPDMRGGDS